MVSLTPSSAGYLTTTACTARVGSVAHQCPLWLQQEGAVIGGNHIQQQYSVDSGGMTSQKRFQKHFQKHESLHWPNKP